MPTRRCIPRATRGNDRAWACIPRYDAVTGDGRGAWFAARTAGGKTVGLSTARVDDSHRAQIDAFAHQDFMGVWEALVQAAINWSASQGVSTCTASVCEEDQVKIASYGAMGFRTAGTGDAFDLDDRRVASVRMEKDLLPGNIDDPAVDAMAP